MRHRLRTTLAASAAAVALGSAPAGGDFGPASLGEQNPHISSGSRFAG